MPKADDISVLRSWRSAAGPAAALCGAALAWWGTADAAMLAPAGRVTFAVFVAMAALWLAGVVAPFAVGLAGLGILASALSTQAFAGADGAPPIPWDSFAREFGSTPVVMTLSGMMLAAGASATGVDRAFAGVVLGPVLGRPRVLLVMLIAVGAVLSMFVSNTATAVLLLTIVAPLVGRLGVGSKSARAMTLAAAFGAAVGGLATPVGTSPNIVAFGLLRERGHDIGFAQWAALGLPVAIVVLVLGARWLVRLGGQFSSWRAEPASLDRVPLDWRGWAWIAVFVATLALWITRDWTGVPLAVASLLPLAVLPLVGILGPSQVRGIDWATLLLMGCGLCVGHAMNETGLARWLVGCVVPTGAATPVVVAAFALVAVSLSTLMSNTATANLLVPMALALPRSELVAPCALAAAFGSSLALGLPVSTPPMLLAYGTGFVRPQELLQLGLVTGIGGTVAAVAVILFAAP